MSALDFENRLYRFCLPVVLLVHLGVCFLNSQWFFPVRDEVSETVISASLVFENSSFEQTALSKAKKGPEAKVHKNLLPQLPKKFKVEDSKAPDSVKAKEKVALSLDEEEAKKKKQAEKKKEEQAKRRAQEKITKLRKEQALERLLKEKLRKEKRLAKETQSPLNKLLAARKRELESHQLGDSTELKGYALILKKWVKRYYVLPETYKLMSLKQPPIVELLIDGEGKITALRLVESSQNDGFDRLAMNTLNKAAPFPKPPRALVGKAIHYHFEYQ